MRGCRQHCYEIKLKTIMLDEFVAFELKFKINEFKFYENDDWVVLLNRFQPTLGASILYNKFQAFSIDQFTSIQAISFHETQKKVKTALELAFKPEKLNFLILMMVDPVFHMHIVPRYAKNRVLNKQQFTDNGWPGLPIMKPTDVNRETLNQIRETLSSAI